ncbi:TPA: hypothetical protein ACIJO6_002315 [Klebsiella aerogenes]|uniref:hypothetical protein n=1 Tax=Klebsiella aerogenes TaxID=548 RepID=UPI00069C318D|nr:hypothetical protein [Klebsiella aerogenes]
MTDINRLIASLKRRSAHVKEFGDDVTFVKLEDLDALVATIEKSREASECPAGVDLQDWVKQLAAENVALKAAFNKPDAWLSCHSIPPTYQEPDRGGEYLAVHEKPGEKNDDGSDSWPVYSKPDIETPATDRIVAVIKADAANQMCVAFVKHKELAGLSDDDVVTVREATDAVLHCAEVISEGAEK